MIILPYGYKHSKDFRYFAYMDIRNNLLVDIKRHYVTGLSDIYGQREAESLVTILIEHFFGIDRNTLILKPEKRLSESEILSLHMAIKELKKMKPVQYITEEVEFQELKLKVSPNVLIPRQETEELVMFIVNNEVDKGLNLLDIGTGSGCIAISLASQLLDPNIMATDISKEVINIASENAHINNVTIDFVVHDILKSEKIQNSNNGKCDKFDIIVSNPPYVTLSDKKKMHANVLDFEPHSALFVPEDNPLIYYDAILQLAEKQLVVGGRIYFEINELLAIGMEKLLTDYNYKTVVVHKDIHGRDRFISAVRNFG